LEFLPGVIRNLYLIRQKLDFELVIVSNQDGLGTPAHPQKNFDLIQRKMLDVFRNEGIIFDKIFIDPSFPEDHLPTRKPGTAMLTEYLTDDYDLTNSFVIGDRPTDVELAKNLGCKALFLNDESLLEDTDLQSHCAFIATDWDAISGFLFAKERRATIKRTTKETDIYIDLDLDGNGKTEISTGLHFFDHILEQIGKHSGINLVIHVKGDLEVDEHHTIEDTGIALGEALLQALGNKRGIERYGFQLPMDESLCSVALDFGGRSWFVWDVEFKREKVGDVPTEMFPNFFKSLSDAAKMNLNIRAEGQNEHHKIEGIFKAFARSITMAIKRDVFNDELPSTKGIL
jgi:imidazoleglycerol-phosphate dehydratase/histidinol-phosphatase